MGPSGLAAKLVEEHSLDPDWLDEFAVALDRRRQGRALERILEVWGLSQSEVGRRFGVSRQAVAKWIADGIPVERAAAMANLGAATDLLVHYLKRDRIAAVVRRPITTLQGDSLVDLLAEERYDDILQVCRDMFDFAAVTK
jgi:transcriptional regulator with XRE-family HTH domain